MVQVHSLQSEEGRKLNGRRAIVLRSVEGGRRWECRMEMERAAHDTKSLKPDNLKPFSRLPLPGQNDSQRGYVSPGDMENLCPKLCELLVYDKNMGRDYSPSDIMLSGFAGAALSAMGQWNFEYFTPIQLEQMAGVLGLAKICIGGELWGTESVLVALVEGDPMYMDVLAQTMYWTGHIIEYSDSVQHLDRDWSGPPTKLTPDQDDDAYIKTMTNGPYCIFQHMNRQVFCEGFWAAMRRSEFVHLVAQRFLRIIAREEQQTKDGKKLGKTARTSLVALVPGVLLPTRVTAANYILEHVEARLSSPSEMTPDAINALLEAR